jgi:hypothetical protein
MDAPELPFEFCALRFLIQWEQREKSLHQQIADNPSLLHIRSALRYFQVARTIEQTMPLRPSLTPFAMLPRRQENFNVTRSRCSF